MTTFKQVPLTCSGHTRPVVHLDFSDVVREGYFLISACKDGKPMLRQGETGDWIGTFEGHKGAVWGVAMTQNAKLAASASADFTAKVWDARYGDVVHTFHHNHIVKVVNFNSENTLFLSAGNEKLIRVFDLNKPNVGPIETLEGHAGNIKSATFLSCSRIASISDDNTMRVWDRRSGKVTLKIEYRDTLRSFELSRDEAILTLAHGSSVSFYSADSFRKMREFHIPTAVYSASLAPNRTSFVCGGEDLKVYKYDYDNGSEIECNRGHFGPVHCVRWAPDGELFATGSEDGTVRLWQGTPGRVYGLWRRSPESSPVASKRTVARAN